MTPFSEIRRFKQMRKSTRLNDMMIFLNDKSYFNLKDIMQEYGISKSTAIRDIQSLEEIGMPIFSETGRNGRYGILKNRLLSPIIFTVDEMYALYFAMLTLNAYESTPFHLSIEKLKKKFETCLSDELINTINKMEHTLSLEGTKHYNSSPLLKDILEMAVKIRCAVSLIKKANLYQKYKCSFLIYLHLLDNGMLQVLIMTGKEFKFSVVIKLLIFQKVSAIYRSQGKNF